jgi:KDO2-lipid IV(A) lauroyltransferase
VADGVPSAIARLIAQVDQKSARLVPLSVARALSLPFGDASYALLAKNRETARRNYAQVLGRPVGDPLVEATTRDLFRQFAAYVAEIMHIQGWGTSDVLDRLEVEGGEHLDEAIALGKGVIFVSAHMGATDVAATLIALKGFQVASVTEPVHFAWLMDWLILSRKRMGVTLLPVERAGVPLIRALKRGGMVAMIADVGLNRGGLPATFFGRETLFPDWPARLARVTGAPVVFGMAARLPHGRYLGHICPPLYADRTADAETDVPQMTQKIATVLEGFVRRYPSQWYAFREMWPTE